jgi:hypothetical protein
VVANRGLIPCSSAAPGLGKDAGGARVVSWPGRGNLGSSLLRYLAWCSRIFSSSNTGGRHCWDL